MFTEVSLFQETFPAQKNSWLRRLLITNYCFYHLWSNPDKNLKNKNHGESFNFVPFTSNKLYFQNLLESFKCTASKHREPMFAITFTHWQVWECNVCIDSSIVMLVKSIFWIGQSLFSVLQPLGSPVNLSSMPVGAIRIVASSASENWIIFLT